MTRYVLLGAVSLVVYYLITTNSSLFQLDNPGINRPILQLLGLFGVLFCPYLFATISLLKNTSSKESSRLIFVLFFFGLAFRTCFLFSQPIQEVDIYRYIWDGHVVAAGHDPYEFPPTAVWHPQIETGIDLPESEGLKQVTENIHFAHLSTPYPPVSQAVFALAAWLTPTNGSVFDHLFYMKFVLVLFDIGIAFGILFLLKLTAKPLSLFVAYWWCPLAIKEIANSGHLDSIAIFFCVAALGLLVKSHACIGKSRIVFALLSAIAISLGIAAKLYPVVLLPLWFLYATKGHRWLVVPLTLFVIALTAILMWPMVKHTSLAQKHVFKKEEVTQTGIETFYNFWEINDLAFMTVVENLKPDETVPEHQRAWFVVTSDEFRKSTTSWFSTKFDVPLNQCAFRITRFIMMGSVALLSVWFCFSYWRRPDDQNWLKMCFMTLAWFWLLSPTQNPWYWLWAMPLIPFVRNRAWYLLSGLLFLYYLRFWFQYHYPREEVGNTPYTGQLFFDFVVPWIEFGPWFVLLMVSGVLIRIYKPKSTRQKSLD